MALNATQQASRLFKKSLGAGETLVSKEFFSEPKLGNTIVLPSQLWAEASGITTTAPILSNGQISGVTQYFSGLTLSVVAGSNNSAYYHDNLKNTIPFNYGDGSYNYALYKNDGTPIGFGTPGGDWLIDTSAGLLTWYGTLPSGVSDVLPPKISFYKYVGATGFTDTSAALLTEISTRGSADSSLSTMISQMSGATLDLGTIMSNGQVLGIIGTSLTGVSYSAITLTEASIRLSVDQSLSAAIGVAGGISLHTISGITSNSSLGALSSGLTLGMVYITNTGTTSANINLGTTPTGNEINPGGLITVPSGTTMSITVNTRLSSTQNMTLYISSASWTNINLTVEWAEITYGNKVNEADFVVLSTSISSETSIRGSADSSLSIAISGLTGNSSLSTALSVEISTRGSGDSSLSTSISGEISSRTSGVSSLSTSLIGVGNVTKVGTPVDNQVGVWTGNGTIEGDSGLTWDGSKLYTAYIQNYDGTSGSTTGKSITISAGSPYNTIDADGGDITIKAGFARSGETGSSAGKVFLIPGDTYSPTSFYGYVTIGGASISQQRQYILNVDGINSNIGLNINQKGSASLALGNSVGTIDMFALQINMNGMSWFPSTSILGFSADTIVQPIKPFSGMSGHTLTVKGGDAYSLITGYGGGHLYLMAGAGQGTGTTGSIYLGTGSGGTNPLSGKTSETNVIYYDTSTGKLSYGIVTGGGGGVTPVSNILYWDSSVSGYTAYSSSGTAGSAGRFYSGTSFVTAADQRLNYTGGLYVNSLTNNAIFGKNDTTYAIYGSSTGGTAGFFQGDTYRAISASSFTGQVLYLQKGGSISSNDSSSTVFITRSSTMTGSFNTTGHMIEILDSPTLGTGYASGSTLKATIDATVRIDMNPRVGDVGTNVAYIFDTSNLLTSGRKLLSVLNNGTPKFYVDYNGNIFTSGVTISANTRRITPITLTSGGTTTWDMNLSSNASVTISGSTTLSITNLVSGDTGTLVIIQSAPSGTLTYPSGSKYSGGVPYTLTGSGGVDILTFYYDGTNYYWNIGLSFA